MATSVTATQMPLVQIANLLGGQKTTTNAGDTSAITSALAGLKGQNYDAMLQSIFQQAAGSIPQLANRMQNAAGARSGSNSAMAAALQDLLKTTTISAQDQLAKQQLANLQTQVQGGSAVAQATKGTTTKSGTDLMQTAKMLAMLQGASKLGLFGDEKPAPTTGKTLAPVSDATPVPVNSFLTQDLTAQNVIPQSTFTGGGQDISYLDAMFAAPEPAPYVPDMATYDYGQQYEPVYDMGDQGFADGGKVEAKEPVEPDDKMTPANSLVAGDTVAINLSFETFRKMLGDSLGKPEGYADGGRVSAAGSRRSSNPTVNVQSPLASLASNVGTPSAAAAGLLGLSALGQSGGNVPAGAIMSPMTGGGATPYVDPEIGQALAMSSALSTLAKTNGYQGLPSEVGLAAGLANSSDTNDAARAGAKYAATTKAGSEAIKEQTGFTGGEVLTAYNVAKALDEGDEAAAINSAMWYVSPPVAAANTVSQMLGGPDIGTVTVDAGEWVDDEVLQPVGDVLGDAGDAVSDVVSGAGNLISDVASGIGGAVSDVGSSIGDFFGWKEGGHIQGPGTGTSDSIPARLSDGEYVIPADVVDKMGVEFFDMLRASLHTPARK
jgi:hypothetical protein